MSKFIFVTGTGTEVGKTYCASSMVKTRQRGNHRVGVYKPVASGCRRGSDGELIADDALSLWHAAGEPLTLQSVCPQRFAMPLSPPQAAAAEGSHVDETLLVDGLDAWADFDTTYIEGAGGLFSPISKSMLNVDLIIALKRTRDVEVVLIAANRLGVQHEVIAAVRASRASGVKIDRVVLNDIAIDSSSSANAECLRQWIDATVEAS